MTSNKKRFTAIVIVFLVLVGFIISIFYFKNKQLQQQNNQNKQQVINDSQPLYNDKDVKQSENLNNIIGNTVKIDIVDGVKRCEFETSDKLFTYYQKILKAIYPDKTEKILYATDSSLVLEDYCVGTEGIDSLILSPNEKYLIFNKFGWEWSKPYMLNIDTGKYVFGDETEINDIEVLRDIKWSSDNKNFFVTTDVNEMGGVGEMGVYASAYNNPDKIKKVWSTKNFYSNRINNVIFVGNDKLKIETEQSDKEGSPKKSITYEYDYKQDKLVIVD